MAIFHCYVSSPEGMSAYVSHQPTAGLNLVFAVRNDALLLHLRLLTELPRHMDERTARAFGW